MRYEIDPGKERRTINFIDNICYSHVTDKNGKPLDLYLSLMLQNGNSEMRLASGRDDEVSTGRQPLIVWINGSGWRSCDKNLMTAEMEFLAEAGYAVAFLYYRGSSEGSFPSSSFAASGVGFSISFDSRKNFSSYMSPMCGYSCSQKMPETLFSR